jgi:hypothetical protein
VDPCMTLETQKWWEANRPRLLQRSLNEFREAYLKRAETGERAAYVEAIRALLGVLLYLEEPLDLSDEDPAYMWFGDLISHLEDLNSGIVPPVFCPGEEGRKGLSTAEWLRRAWAVHAIELLHATGTKYAAAAKRAIRGYQLHGVSEKEALSWCAEFRKGRVKNREAAEVYKDYMAAIQGFNAQQLQDSIAILCDEWKSLRQFNVGE